MVINLPNKKQTSKRVAKIASKILKDERYSAASKKVAGSALSRLRKSKILLQKGDNLISSSPFCTLSFE
jgi:hypothetical protein